MRCLDETGCAVHAWRLLCRRGARGGAVRLLTRAVRRGADGHLPMRCHGVLEGQLGLQPPGAQPALLALPLPALAWH